ncbi:MAG: hypothetical protein KAT68_13060 [Bacteroidales bacterium]|nr:hypothetical protein [Bacteroidales bacterium]
MKIYKIFIRAIIFLFLLFNQSISFSQCRNYIPANCNNNLFPFIHDGINNSKVLNSGQKFEVFKVFYKKQDYRIVICSDNNLPPLEFELLDMERNILFSNKEYNLSQLWDFSLDDSMQLIISVKVPDIKNTEQYNKTGCVALIVGFMDTEKYFTKYY